VSGRRLFVLLLPLLVAATLAQAARTRDLLAASRRLQAVALVSGQVAGAGARAAPVLRANLGLLREAAAMDPADVRVPMGRGSLHLLLGNPLEAANAYREALRLEPRPEVHLNLGRALAAAGQGREARRHFDLAVRLAPELAAQVPADGR
jgi:tetratricopeptide (TPR) repeat protein